MAAWDNNLATDTVMMKKILAAALLLATPALAQEQPRYTVPGDMLTAVTDYLKDGGSHREGQALRALLMIQATKVEPPKPPSAPPAKD